MGSLHSTRDRLSLRGGSTAPNLGRVCTKLHLLQASTCRQRMGCMLRYLSRPGTMMKCQVGRARSCSPPRWLNTCLRRTANKQTTRLLHRRDMCQPDTQDRRRPGRAYNCSPPRWLSTCLRRTENKHTTSLPQRDRRDMRQRGTPRGRLRSQRRRKVSRAGRQCRMPPLLATFRRPRT